MTMEEAQVNSQLNGGDPVDQVSQLAMARTRITKEVHKRIVGQDAAIDLLMIALFCKGHGLFVGVPGLAKTLLINTLAQCVSLEFNRVQFTPDLMPSDITGTDVLQNNVTTGQREFQFIQGPVFANILLADEINRTPPKTQAALLQAMAEGQVTAGGKTYSLPTPYCVFATQNPIEQEGTYPLPEAQLDRFLLQINVDYPSAEDEAQIVRRTTQPVDNTLDEVLTQQNIIDFQSLIPEVPVADHVIHHAVGLVRATRPNAEASAPIANDYLAFGAGPRASQSLILTAKARAALNGRFVAEREDVDAMAHSVLRHRLVLNYRGEADRVSPDRIIDSLLEQQR